MTATADFTEAAYAELLDQALRRFRLTTVIDGSGLACIPGVALWRHDVDFSPHRALALAKLEAARGISATYYVMLGSAHYNAFEPAIRDLIRQIAELGHEIGLHFDASTQTATDLAGFERALAFEAAALAGVAQADIRSFSVHNPTVAAGVAMDAPRHAGLLNASTASLREQFTYCSDSNGVWRFRPLSEVLADPEVNRLYALTHPEWWQQDPMPPRARIQRCIDGRSARVGADYDNLLSTHGRPNV